MKACSPRVWFNQRNGLTTTPPASIFTTGQKNTSAGEFRGLRIRAPNATVGRTLALLGAIPDWRAVRHARGFGKQRHCRHRRNADEVWGAGARARRDLGA